MHTNLQALKVRKQRVTGSTPLTELQQQAESASERLLLAKLQEAGRIMEEQETVRRRAVWGAGLCWMRLVGTACMWMLLGYKLGSMRVDAVLMLNLKIRQAANHHRCSC